MEFAHALSILLGRAQASGDVQFLLGRAVRDARNWLNKKGYEAKTVASQSEPPWHDVELHFSQISELPRVTKDEGAIDIWFSRSDVKVHGST